MGRSPINCGPYFMDSGVSMNAQIRDVKLTAKRFGCCFSISLFNALWNKKTSLGCCFSQCTSCGGKILYKAVRKETIEKHGTRMYRQREFRFSPKSEPSQSANLGKIQLKLALHLPTVGRINLLHFFNARKRQLFIHWYDLEIFVFGSDLGQCSTC